MAVKQYTLKSNCVFGINELLIFKIFVLFVCFFHLIEILFYIFVVASFQSRESEVCGLDYEHSLPFGRSSSRELKWKKKRMLIRRAELW